MDSNLFFKRILLLGIFGLLVLCSVVTDTPAKAAPAAEWTFEGYVYEGVPFEETRPIVAVTVSIYGAYNPYPDTGTFIRSTSTDSTGWYGLTVYDTDGPYEFYSIQASDLNDYVSTGASTEGGYVGTYNWIVYEVPLTGKTLTGNRFWDRAPVLSGKVFAGTVGDESTPLSNVTVKLYCSHNQYPDQGSVLSSTVTIGSGWYGLSTYRLNGLCDFYHIVESDPSSYFSVGATSVSGVVRQTNWIEYGAPYATKTLTGNKFWDDTIKVYFPIVMKH